MQNFDGIDIIKASMNARFNQDGIHTVAQIEHLLISAVNGVEIDEDWASLDVFKQFHTESRTAQPPHVPQIVQSRPIRAYN